MTQDIMQILPEILLAGFAILALMAGAYGGQDKIAQPILWATSAVLIVLAAMVALSAGETTQAFGGMFINDGFARFAKVVILVSAACVLIMS
jgi:NADH-quinone oxidoreductase subunit N